MTLQNLLEMDARWSARLRVAEKPGPLRTAAVWLAHSGDSWYWGLAMLALWLLAGAEWRYRAVLIVLAIGGLAVVVQVLKWTVRRQRPPGEWGQLYRNVDPHSFPSGHAARALMLAALGVLVGPPWFGLLLCLWGPLVALARVAMGVHYVSDIVAGAVIGAAFGLGVGLTHAVWMAWLPTWLVG